MPRLRSHVLRTPCVGTAENIWGPPPFWDDIGYGHKWLFTLYWGIVGTGVIGFDVYPRSVTETIYTIFCAILGLFGMSLLIGGASESIGEMNAMAAKTQQQLESLQHYMRYRRVPLVLQRRVRDFYTYMQDSSSRVEEDLFSSLPGSLQRQLTIALHQKLFINVRIFHRCDASITIDLAERLQPRIALPHEFLVLEGELVDALYLLSRGHAVELQRDAARGPATALELVLDHQHHEQLLDVASNHEHIRISQIGRSASTMARNERKEQTVLRELFDFDSIGEEAFFASTPSPVSVQAMSYCDLMMLSPAG